MTSLLFVGITREELLANFEPEIAALSQANDINTKEVVETMTRQYDGYHFHPNGEGVSIHSVF